MANERSDRSHPARNGKPALSWKQFAPVMFVLVFPGIFLLAVVGLSWLDLISEEWSTVLSGTALGLILFNRTAMRFWTWKLRAGRPPFASPADIFWLLGLFLVSTAWLSVPYFGWRIGWISSEIAFISAALGFALTQLLTILIPRAISRRMSAKQSNTT